MSYAFCSDYVKLMIFYAIYCALAGSNYEVLWIALTSTLLHFTTFAKPANLPQTIIVGLVIQATPAPPLACALDACQQPQQTHPNSIRISNITLPATMALRVLGNVKLALSSTRGGVLSRAHTTASRTLLLMTTPARASLHLANKHRPHDLQQQQSLLRAPRLQQQSNRISTSPRHQLYALPANDERDEDLGIPGLSCNGP